MSKNHRCVYHFLIFYKFALILFISFSYEPSRQYGTSPFFLNILKKNEMVVKGVSGKSGFFLIELPIELPIDSGVE